MDANVSDAEIERLLTHSAWLSALARRLVRDPAAAEDLVQDTWLAALRSPGKGERKERGWLAAVIENLARARSRGEARRREREQRVASVEKIDGPDRAVQRAESQRALLAHVLALEDPYRATLLARYIDGFSAAEIARRTNTHESTVRMRIARALDRLRERLASEHRVDPMLGLGVLLVRPGGGVVAPSATSIVVSKAAGAALGAWIMSTTTKIALAAAVVVCAWFAWRQIEPVNGLREAGVAATTKPAEPAIALPEQDPPAPNPQEVPAAIDQREALKRDTVTLLRIQTVSIEDGKPLLGVPVHAYPPAERKGWSFKFIEGSRGTMHEMPLTASDGFAEIEACAGVPLVVLAGGRESGVGDAQVDVEALKEGETRIVTLRLRSAMDLVFCARVVDATTHAAIAGAKVKLRSGAVPEAQKATLESDADGRFSVLVQSWNNASLTLEAEGYASIWVLPTAEHATAEQAFEVALSRPATLRVHILENSGKPVQGAWLMAKVARYKLMQPEDHGLLNQASFEDDFFQAETDATGTAVLSNLPPRAGLELSARRLRESLRSDPTPLTLQPGEERELTWRIGSGCRIFGVVKSADGKPVNGQEIWLVPRGPRMPGARFFDLYEAERKSTRCDERDEFEFSDVPPGSWLVGPAAVRGQSGAWQDGLVAPWAQAIEVREADGELRVDVLLTRDLAIRGHVEDPDGKPVERRLVIGVGESGATAIANSAADGSFVLGPLVPGIYRVTAMAITAPPVLDVTNSRESLVEAGARDVVLRLQRGGSLAGRVVDAESGASVAAQMTLVPEPGQDGVRFMTMLPNSTAESGFLIPGLPPATYSLAARTTSGRVGFLRRITLAAGEQRTDVVIRVAQGATVNVLYDGSGRAGQIRVLFDGVVISADGIEKGTRRGFAVPAGHSVARMTFYPEAIDFDIDLDLKAGETKELIFDSAWKSP